MSKELFDVVFYGILQTGKDKDLVMQNMARLFKTDADRLAPYFIGGRKVIKGNINSATAEKYREALENVGLVITVEPRHAQSEQAEVQQTTQGEPQSDNPDNNAAETGALTLAPLGADVIENPVAAPVQKIEDIGFLTLAEPGVDIIENPVETPVPVIDDSGITMAEAGSNVLDHPAEITPQKIDDISDISMAEAGADVFENPPPKKKAEIPDFSALSLCSE